RGTASPRLTLDWFALWQSPELAPLIKDHPRVLLKLQRPYLLRGLDTQQRWRILRDHYCFTLKHFSAAAFAEIFTAPGAWLAEVPVSGAGTFSLRLFYHDLYEKEGELSLIFYDEQKQSRVCVLSFCVFSCRPGRRHIFIGGLQGFKPANQREFVAAVTRAMFGLRPKALLLFALQEISSLWNIRSIRAVSNETRNLRGKRSGIRADYDEFWLQSGGRLESDGNFTLPFEFTPRALTGIRPNKRSLYRHRYEMLAGISASIRQNMTRLAGAPHHSLAARNAP
ncbi:MAG TPA: DUF535 family protein, partial [Verrucomicrobiae bacterium]|nr:DUF535 family protein [Verrucomicrobiae bacterium]